MGWTSYEATYFKNNGNIDRKKECDAYFMEGLNRGHFEVLKSTMVGSVYYAAVKYLSLNRVVGIVILTQTQGREFAYKPMTEDMIPCYYDCPETILKLLSDTTDKNALQWREVCRDKAAANKTLKKLPVGAAIYIEKADKPKILIKMPPMYQFKTAWWAIYGENAYFPKNKIPSYFKVLPQIEYPIVGIIKDYKGLSETNYLCSLEDFSKAAEDDVFSDVIKNKRGELYLSANNTLYFYLLLDAKEVKEFLSFCNNDKKLYNPDWYCKNSYEDFFAENPKINPLALSAMIDSLYYF